MRKAFLTVFAALAFAGVSHASDLPQPPTDYTYGSKSDSDACGATLCLLGTTRDGDCNKYVTKYFSIIRTKHGKFSPSRTAEARGDFVAQCVEDQSSAKSANDKWGSVQRGF
ncbi:TrbM/KikA/MpfK family conjugal transfer protein [Pseudomonas putida]|uniref:TrbM/KikA/MpfK family conjugal transfer protein n=1 Tax=Pseudomonas putida TaxID=303 RepID=UPI0035254286